MNNRQAKVLFTLAMSISILGFITGLISLLTPGFYFTESADWQGQCYVQDLLNITLVLPCSYLGVG